MDSFEIVVVGGGPAGATAASDLARAGRSVLLLDRLGRIKPCGGAIPPRLIDDFSIPSHLLTARITSARVVSPSLRQADMPIVGGFVGMVDRSEFDPWLRERAVADGAVLRRGSFVDLHREAGGVVLRYRVPGTDGVREVRAKAVVGADGARSAVARQAVKGAEHIPHVYAVHEVVRTPGRQDAPGACAFEGGRCDVIYDGTISPDFYGWVFPHGDTVSVGLGTAIKGFPVREALSKLRRDRGLAGAELLRREGAPIPLRPLSRWDDGARVVLAGDAAGVVAPASGEGIYYAMASGRLVAEALARFCASGEAHLLREPRARFMREHGAAFRMLGLMQRFWYANDGRRERFVSICRDPDVQRLTWDAYMTKTLVRASPRVHLRIMAKNLIHLTGLVPA